MQRRGFLKLAATLAVASTLTRTTVQAPQEQIKLGPRIERYGWIDDDGNEVIGYRKVFPGTEDYYFNPSKNGGWWQKELPKKESKCPSLLERALRGVSSALRRSGLRIDF